MSHAGSWYGADDDDAKSPYETKFGLTGVINPFSGNSAWAYQYYERVPVSLQPRRNPTSRTNPADGLCPLQNTSTAENSSKNTKPVKIVPAKYLSTNQQQPVKATDSNSMDNKISNGSVVYRTTPLQLEHKREELSPERKRPILPLEKMPSKEEEEVIDLVSGDEDSNRITTSTNTREKWNSTNCQFNDRGFIIGTKRNAAALYNSVPLPVVASPKQSSSRSECDSSSSDGDGHSGGMSRFEWLQALLAEHEYGLFPLEKLLPVIQLLRDADIYSAKCFLLISNTSLDDLLGRLQLTEGLQTSIKGMHKDAQK